MKSKHLMGIMIMIIILSLSFPNKSCAQATPEELMNNFFELFDKDLDNAIDYLFSTNNLIDPRQPGIQSIKEKFDISRKMLGNYYGYEIVSRYYAGDSYVKYIYSLKYERQPVKFIVILYKPDKKWKVQNVNFHDDISTEFILKNQ